MKVLVSFFANCNGFNFVTICIGPVRILLQIGKCEKEITSAAQQWIDAQDNLMNTKIDGLQNSMSAALRLAELSSRPASRPAVFLGLLQTKAFSISRWSLKPARFKN